MLLLGLISINWAGTKSWSNEMIPCLLPIIPLWILTQEEKRTNNERYKKQAIFIFVLNYIIIKDTLKYKKSNNTISFVINYFIKCLDVFHYTKNLIVKPPSPPNFKSNSPSDSIYSIIKEKILLQILAQRRRESKTWNQTPPRKSWHLQAESQSTS